MILNYNKRFENDCDKQWLKFIGYITPEGETLNYCLPFGGGGHNRNNITDTFLKYFYYDFTEKRRINGEHLQGEEYKSAFREYCINELMKDIPKTTKTINNFSQVKACFTKELLKSRIQYFFLNCYQNEDFFKSFGQSIMLMDYNQFKKIYKDKILIELEEDIDAIERYMRTQYNTYWHNVILSSFKDVMVQYLGYDSVERVMPRTITTSHINVNERFYNYKLMDFSVFQVPRMMWYEESKIYRPAPIEYQTEKEEILGKEIESIKKLVKIEERYQYFRK